MARVWMLVIIGLAAFLLTTALFFFINSSSAATPSQSPLSCNDMLVQGPTNEQTNLLFVGTAEQAQEYSDYILSYEPFASQRDQFNIYRIDKNFQCERYKGIALYCYSRELLSQAADCPHDYIIALEEASPTIRASAYMGVASINTRLPKTVILHELGHLLGLDEEYDAGYNPGSGSPNCKTTCEQFEQELCYEECSDGLHSRSVDEGVMRTLSPADTLHPYGEYNQDYLAQKLSRSKASITGFVTSEEECAGRSYMVIEVKPGESWEANVVDIEQGCTPAQAGEYTYTLNDASGEAVFEGSFNSPILFTDGNEDQDSEIEGEAFEDQPFFITAPADTGAATFTITDNENNQVASGPAQLNNLLCRI